MTAGPRGGRRLRSVERDAGPHHLSGRLLDAAGNIVQRSRGKVDAPTVIVTEAHMPTGIAHAVEAMNALIARDFFMNNGSTADSAVARTRGWR